MILDRGVLLAFICISGTSCIQGMAIPSLNEKFGKEPASDTFTFQPQSFGGEVKTIIDALRSLSILRHNCQQLANVTKVERSENGRILTEVILQFQEPQNHEIDGNSTKKIRPQSKEKSFNETGSGNVNRENKQPCLPIINSQGVKYIENITSLVSLAPVVNGSHGRDEALPLNTKGLTHTQLVVISTCSAVIGVFFIVAFVIRLRNYVKRVREEARQAQRPNFRGYSVVLQGNGGSKRKTSMGPGGKTAVYMQADGYDRDHRSCSVDDTQYVGGAKQKIQRTYSSPAKTPDELFCGPEISLLYKSELTQSEDSGSQVWVSRQESPMRTSQTWTTDAEARFGDNSEACDIRSSGIDKLMPVGDRNISSFKTSLDGCGNMWPTKQEMDLSMHQTTERINSTDCGDAGRSREFVNGLQNDVTDERSRKRSKVKPIPPKRTVSRPNSQEVESILSEQLSHQSAIDCNPCVETSSSNILTKNSGAKDKGCERRQIKKDEASITGSLADINQVEVLKQFEPTVYYV